MAARRTSNPGTTADPPRSLEEALSRASGHARNAVAESLLAARSLLDAVSLALLGEAASGNAGLESGVPAALASIAEALEALSERARGADASMPDSLARALFDALDSEIARWEQRSASDPDARAVLRAFLGLREILWELGVRSSEEGGKEPATAHPDASGDDGSEGDPPSDSPRVRPPGPGRRKPPKPPRVRRIQVDG